MLAAEPWLLGQQFYHVGSGVCFSPGKIQQNWPWPPGSGPPYCLGRMEETPGFPVLQQKAQGWVVLGETRAPVTSPGSDQTKACFLGQFTGSYFRSATSAFCLVLGAQARGQLAPVSIWPANWNLKKIVYSQSVSHKRSGPPSTFPVLCLENVNKLAN